MQEVQMKRYALGMLVAAVALSTVAPAFSQPVYYGNGAWGNASDPWPTNYNGIITVPGPNGTRQTVGYQNPAAWPNGVVPRSVRYNRGLNSLPVNIMPGLFGF
jgi:hypothetical protein